MNRIALIFFLYLCAILPGFAQWSVIPEISLSAIKRGNPYTSKTVSAWNPSWKIGVGIDYRFDNSRWGIGSGLYWSQPSWNTDTKISSETEVIQYAMMKIKNNSLKLPVIAHWTIPLKTEKTALSFGVGPYVGYGFSHKANRKIIELPYAPSGSWGYNFDSFPLDSYFDWGCLLRIGLNVQNWIALAEYEMPLAKEYNTQSIGPKYHTFSLGIGYRFTVH